jgi:hypothetical protein
VVRNGAPTAILVLALGAVCQAAPDLEGTVALSAGTKRVVVVDRAQAPGHAARALRVTLRALPLLEAVAGFPLPLEAPVRVEVHRTQETTCNEVGYLDVADRTVKAWRRIPDWLLVHELAHYWFLDRFAPGFAGRERWLIEGLAHYAAVEVCRRAPDLGNPAWIHHVLIERSLLAGPEGFDPPLPEWVPAIPAADAERSQRISWYGKAYGFFVILRGALGPEGIARLNAALAPRATTAAYLKAALAASPALEGLGPGWLRAGERGRAFGYPLLRDSDGDGLCGAEERTHALRTGPRRSSSPTAR